MEFDAETMERVELMMGNAAELGGGLSQLNLDPCAPLMQPTRRHKSATAVSTRSGENDHGFAARVILQESLVSKVAIGHLHYLDEVDPDVASHEVVDNEPIDQHELYFGRLNYRF